MNIFFQDLQIAIPIGLLLSVLVGPVFFILLETSVVKGTKAAIILDAGVILADIVYFSIAFLSSYKLMEQIKHNPAFYVFGGSIMFVYGFITLIKKQKKESLENPTAITIPKNQYIALFAKGFLLNIINIGVLVFWLFVIFTLSPELNYNSTRIILVFGEIMFVYFLIDLIKIFLAKQFRSKMTPHKIYIIRKLIGVILIVTSLYLFYKGFNE